MRKSFSHSSLSLLPGPPCSPRPRSLRGCCSPSTQRQLAQAMLAALALVVVVLLVLIARAAPSTKAAADLIRYADASVSAQSSELPPLPLSPHPASRWADLTPPLSRETLGQATWPFLHTLAALYPTQPSELEQRAAERLLEAIGWLYPCRVCAEHFRSMLTARPPRVGSRRELSEWLCETHNEVNARLDKPTVDCSEVATLWPSELRQCGCGPEDMPGNSTAVMGEAG